MIPSAAVVVVVVVVVVVIVSVVFVVAVLVGSSSIISCSCSPNLVKVSVIFKPFFLPNHLQIQAMGLLLLLVFLLCKNPNK